MQERFKPRWPPQVLWTSLCCCWGIRSNHNCSSCSDTWPRYTASYILILWLVWRLREGKVWKSGKEEQMSKTLKWLQQMWIIWNFHFLRVKNEFLHGFAEPVLIAHSCLKLHFWIFFKEVNSSRLFCSKYHASILTAYSSFPQVILPVQLKHFCRSGRKLTSLVNILTSIFFSSQYASTVQQPPWVTDILLRSVAVVCEQIITIWNVLLWEESENDKFRIGYDSYITAIAFDPSDILLYFTICFPQITSGLCSENCETLKGISCWDCCWKPDVWDMNHLWQNRLVFIL